MNNEPTYQELENHIVLLQEQNEILRVNFSFQSEEKVKRADELTIANIELEYQNKEKEKREDELIIANIELTFQNKEKAKRAAELLISKIKFAQQSNEKEKLEEELIIANLALALQSELIIAKEKAEENEIQLRELNETKDKLFSIIAHDLRSPFNSILGFSDLLINIVNSQDTEKTKKYSSLIYLTARNTLILLDNLLDWGKSQTGKINFNPEKLILSSIIQNVVETSRSNAIIKNISLNIIPLDDIAVCADQNMLKTVLRNLISNAIKFTNLNGEININSIQNQDFCEINISDNGVGMNQEKCNRLFNLNTNITTIGTANEKGSGLGLILCKEFVEKLGGNIWVESKEGKGSNFKFTLPLSK